METFPLEKRQGLHDDSVFKVTCWPGLEIWSLYQSQGHPLASVRVRAMADTHACMHTDNNSNNF